MTHNPNDSYTVMLTYSDDIEIDSRELESSDIDNIIIDYMHYRL